MRCLILVAFTLCPTIQAQQNLPAPLTTKTAKIEEIFRLTKTDQMQKQMMVQMSAMLKQQMATAVAPGQQQGVAEGMQKAMEFMAQKVGWDVMKPDFVRLYDDTYTEDEISGILMFYQSQTGQAMLAKTPELMTKTMTLVQKRMAEVMPELQEMIKKTVSK